MGEIFLSYDIAVFQRITSCNKSVMTTRNNTAGISKVIDDVRNNNVNFL